MCGKSLLRQCNDSSASNRVVVNGEKPPASASLASPFLDMGAKVGSVVTSQVHFLSGRCGSALFPSCLSAALVPQGEHVAFCNERGASTGFAL